MRSYHHVHAHGTGQLGDAGNGQLHLLAGGHNEVAELVDDHHDVRHELMAVVRIELTRLEFGVVLLDVAHLGLLQQVVAVVHELAEAFERLHHLGHIGDDGVLVVVGYLGQEMVLDGGIDGELHLFGVDHHEFQLGRMFLVEQRGDDGVQTHGLTLTRGTGHQQVGHLGEIHHEHLVGDGLSQGYGEFEGGFLEFPRIEDALHRHDARVLVGHFDTDGALAGDGRYDADAERGERQGYIVLEVADFVDAHAGGGGHFVEGNGGADGGLDTGNLHPEVAQHGDDAVLVGQVLGLVDGSAVVIVMFEQGNGGELIELQILAGVVRFHFLHLLHRAPLRLAVGFGGNDVEREVFCRFGLLGLAHGYAVSTLVGQCFRGLGSKVNDESLRIFPLRNLGLQSSLMVLIAAFI